MTSWIICKRTAGCCRSIHSSWYHTGVSTCLRMYSQDASSGFFQCEMHRCALNNGRSQKPRFCYHTLLLIVVWIYHWPQTEVVLHLRIVEPHVYASIEIHLELMSGNLSLSNVRRLPYARRRNDVPYCWVYVVLLCVRLRSNWKREFTRARNATGT